MPTHRPRLPGGASFSASQAIATALIPSPSALAYSAVWSSPGTRMGDHKRSVCAARSASSQLSNPARIGPSVRRADAAQRPNISRSRLHASHQASLGSEIPPSHR
jgi:hypothetical protein